MGLQKFGKRKKGDTKLKSVRAKLTDGMGSKRRLAKFGKEQQRGMRGTAANYITRSQALKRLQITLKDFRKLCILKGIYPRDPKKKVKGSNKTYYYIKDVMYLAHEPMLQHFRDLKTFLKKMKRAVGRKNLPDAQRREENAPTYTLVHILKERYPRFTDAVADLDDALCMVHLFAIMPSNGSTIQSKRTSNCLKLVREWQNYVASTGSLTKVFVSIKGIYYRATVCGQEVTWLVPHQFTPQTDAAVDVKVMMTFLEFYEVLLQFVNYKLYTDIGIAYPPKINLLLDDAGAQLRSLQMEKADEEEEEVVEEKTDEENDDDDALTEEQKKRSEKLIGTLKDVIEEEEEEDSENNVVLSAENLLEPLEAAFASDEVASQIFQKHADEEASATVFKGLNFFLSREVPHASLELVIRAFGGVVSWSGTGSPYTESDSRITHHVMDRPHQGHRYFNREYVQPQWVFDSINTGMLLPTSRYVPGAALPPHLSPFVDNEKEGYTPDYAAELENMKSARDRVLEKAEGEEEELDSEDEDAERQFAMGMAAELKQSDDEEENKPASNKRKVADEEEEPKLSKKARKEQEEKELKELAKSMMSKKAKRLYERMHYGIDAKASKVATLEKKRAELRSSKKSD